jgi:hypothetical protein
MKKFINLSCLILLLVTFTGCAIPLPCSPQIIEYTYDFSAGEKELEYTVLPNNQVETFEFWMNGNKYTDINERIIVLHINEATDYVDMKIGVDYALCDVNDSYTDLKEDDIVVIVGDEEFTLSDNDVFRIEKSHFDKEIVSTATYKGAFKTKRIIRINKDT